jgi:ABC-type polysaccharide/polyol phosphate export permease
MLGVGYLLGFRLHTNMPALVAAAGVLLLFGFAISWVNALLGLVAKSAEAAAAASLPLTVVLAFPSSAFLLTRNMPGPLRAYASHQPLTATVNAIRALLLGEPTTSHAPVPPGRLNSRARRPCTRPDGRSRSDGQQARPR